jgi:hypothetical protein
MADFHDDILAPSEMALIHDAMIGRFYWFEHVGRFSRYLSYLTGGLQPRDPDRDDDGHETSQQSGEIVLERVVCLRPIDTVNSTPNRGDRQFRMAISNRDLPPAIGLDRSHGPAINLAASLKTANPGWSNSDVFIEIAHRLGSFVSYRCIAPSAIRVWTKGSPSYNLGSWPLLIDTKESHVQSF